MARSGNKIIDTGDKFPSLKLKTLDGSEIETPEGLKNPWNVILFYRGFWCPFCKAQLKSFQNGLEKLSGEGIGVLAVSVDPLDRAKETRKETGATFQVAYGVPVKEPPRPLVLFTMQRRLIRLPTFTQPDSCWDLMGKSLFRFIAPVQLEDLLDKMYWEGGWESEGAFLVI